ncbi:MAG: amidohydrolase family protein [Bryobacteraceae bacterium]
MKSGFRLYDTHTHLGSAFHSGRQMTADAMLAHMDAAGIDRSLLIPFPVVADYRAEHDLIARAVREYPDRFTGALCMNPFLPEQEVADEVRRGVEQLGLRALKLQPQFCGLNPLSTKASWFFGLANEHHLPVIVHTGAGAPFALPSLLIAPARQYPELPIVAAHCGSSIYYLEAIIAAQVCPNIYLDLSSLMPHQSLDVIKHVPANRVMAGSDVPESAAVELGKIVDLPVDESIRRTILWDAPRRVFDGVL